MSQITGIYPIFQWVSMLISTSSIWSVWHINFALKLPILHLNGIFIFFSLPGCLEMMKRNPSSKKPRGYAANTKRTTPITSISLAEENLRRVRQLSWRRPLKYLNQTLPTTCPLLSPASRTLLYKTSTTPGRCMVGRPEPHPPLPPLHNTAVQGPGSVSPIFETSSSTWHTV